MTFGVEITTQVEDWEDVTAVPHCFGGTEFRIGKSEFGHIHGNRQVDIPFTRRLRELLIAEQEAETHQIMPESGWVTVYLRGEEDMERAMKLIRLSYLQTLRQCKKRRCPVIESEIRQLPFSEQVIEAVL